MGVVGRKKSFFRSRWFLGVIFVLAILSTLAYGRAYYQDYQIQSEIKQLQESVRRMESKKIETLDAIKYLKSPDFVEEKARKELNMVKPGEQVAVVSGTVQPVIVGQSERNMIEQTEVSNIVKWWNYFFNN